MASTSLGPSLTATELTLVGDRELFLAKERTILKVQALLATLQAGLHEELAGTTLLLPPGFDPAKAQSVKGERLEQCPYQYLDYPKHFLGDDKFTFRSLCWWGHHLVFGMLVEGGQVKQCKKNFFDRFHQLAGHGLELSLARIIPERFCCNRRFTAATGLRPAGSPLGSSPYCMSTLRILPAPRAGLAT